MIQVHDIYCALYFYYYYINSTSDNQVLDPRGQGPQSRPHSQDWECLGMGVRCGRKEERGLNVLKAPIPCQELTQIISTQYYCDVNIPITIS